MPTTGVRDEDLLIDLFLSVYEGGTWAGELSMRESPERARDGGVELVAEQLITGRTLAIEHTLIEPFVGERSDYYQHFKEFQRRLTTEDSLREPGVALYVNAPINVLPRRTKWQLIIDDVCAWLGAAKSSFGTEPTIRQCPSTHHPASTIPLQVRRQPLEGTTEAFVIVQRYGDMRVDESVRKALEQKLPKLVSTAADRRILMLERDQGFVFPESICASFWALRSEFPACQDVHEMWIADTASFEPTKDYVEFVRRGNGKRSESFSFYRGKLLSIARDGMPIQI